ncbi:MAG TPA: NADH-quinone oxidoreductase subunit J [Gemmataceae bacterium]|nr:NADH-quinone oxidoreductase subunit J [Gemmataceae bacterium]
MNPPDLTTLLFYALVILTGLCALGVVVTQNIVRAAAWLLFALGGVGGVFFFLGADFVGATQLIVYVGGTLVLVVFGVMLTAQGPFINLRASAGEWALSIVVGLSLFAVLAVTVGLANWDRSAGSDRSKGALTLVQADDPESSPNSALIGHSFLGQPIGPNKSSYLLPFEIVSVHLLVVLIGAAYLARAKRRRGAAANAAADVR